MTGRLALYLGSSVLGAIAGAAASPLFGKDEEGQQRVSPLDAALVSGMLVPPVAMTLMRRFPDAGSWLQPAVERTVEVVKEQPGFLPFISPSRVWAFSKGRGTDYKSYVRYAGAGNTFRSPEPGEFPDPVWDLLRKLAFKQPGTQIYIPNLNLSGIAIRRDKKDRSGAPIHAFIVTNSEALQPEWYKPYLDEIESLMAGNG